MTKTEYREYCVKNWARMPSPLAIAATVARVRSRIEVPA
jgi:hypothetical protein